MPNPDRIDFTRLQDGRISVTKLRRDAANRRDVPLEHDIHNDLELKGALDWCRDNGYTVRRWYNGARAWRGQIWIIRTRYQIMRMRQELEAQALRKFRQEPGRWHQEESTLALDLAYDG